MAAIRIDAVPVAAIGIDAARIAAACIAAASTGPARGGAGRIPVSTDAGGIVSTDGIPVT